MFRLTSNMFILTYDIRYYPIRIEYLISSYSIHDKSYRLDGFKFSISDRI